jgi:hypothetical protein
MNEREKIKMLNPKLLEILACPKCKGDLEYDDKKNVLLCPACRLKYRVEDGDIPIMLIDEAEKY